MEKKKMLIILLVIVVASIYAERLDVTPMEEFNIPAGWGYDIKKELGKNVENRVVYSAYDFKKEGKQGSRIIEGKGKSIGETREERQLKSDKPSLFGIQRITIISEKKASFGISNIINLQFANPKINDRGIVVVCKGRAEEILTYKVEGYPSSADYIEGLIQNATNYNFLSKNYTYLNIYTSLESEGKNLVLPYIELKNREIVLSGMAMFKEDKMAYVLPLEEGKIMNMLREKKGKGILSIQESPDKYISYDAVVKRKIICNKREGKYEFIINLDFQGDIINNTLYKELSKKRQKEIEQLMGKNIEKMCDIFLGKMKTVYKIDCLDLGMYGVAKHGRETGVDWNSEICNADIKVNVKVKIDKTGIGQY